MRTSLVSLIILAVAAPAIAQPHRQHHANAQAKQIIIQKRPCLKYLTMYAVDCPYLKGYCHGDFQLCGNQENI
jgi:hypothetical protein